MSRLIFVPQYPTPMRYQSWWLSEFSKNFWKHYDNVLVLGIRSHFGIKDPLSSKSYDDNSWSEALNSDSKMFSPIDPAIKFETEQIQEFMDMNIQKDDTLFCADISFPGFFSNVLYHKKMENAYCYCHASSLNKYDYFQPVRRLKFMNETAHSKLFKRVFVGSYYHANKLYKKGWKNLTVVGLPEPPYKTFKEEKVFDIISVARPNIQKTTKKVEKFVEKKFGKIIRQPSNTWLEYYQFLSQAKILLISSKEDTFNYSIMEAIMNNTIPLAPTRCSFPELLSRDYLYNSLEELKEKISFYLSNYSKIPKLLNQNIIDKFYENIIGNMI